MASYIVADMKNFTWEVIGPQHVRTCLASNRAGASIFNSTTRRYANGPAEKRALRDYVPVSILIYSEAFQSQDAALSEG